MGIPTFFKKITKEHNLCSFKLKNEVQHFYLDFNSVIYDVIKLVEKDFRDK